MKSITIKLTSLLFIFAVSFPSLACDQSTKIVNEYTDTDALSTEMMQQITDAYNEASF